MTVHISPGKISGTICVPGSKSIMQRCCALALLRGGETRIHNASGSEDDLAALNVIRALGAEVFEDGESLNIISKGLNLPVGELNCGESGLSGRMFTPIAALIDKSVTLTGSGTLMNRPMRFFEEVLPRLGVTVSTNHGKLPITVRGPLQPQDIEVSGAEGSQYITGLLFAFAASATKPVTIRINNIVSRPYIDLSLAWMKHFGFSANWRGDSEIVIDKRQDVSKGALALTLEGDWSNAAVYMVAAALSGTLQIKGLDLNSVQGDKAILSVLSQAGVEMVVKDKVITVMHTRNILPFHFNAAHAPDLVPPLAVLAMYAAGTSCITGIHRLLHKESNRLQSVQHLLSVCGIRYETAGDALLITGGEVNGGAFDSYHDHRMVMAAAVAALRSEKGISILHAESVRKSNPDFFDHLREIGVQLKY